MSPSTPSAVSAYRQVGFESAVLGANPHGLIALLFAQARAEIAGARVALEQGATVAKCRSIARAIALVADGLAASLDREAGGLLAERLVTLYEYLVRRLAQANARNDDAALAEAQSLLETLEGAWRSIAPETGVLR